MENRSDFTVDASVFQEAIDGLAQLMPQYQAAISRIRTATGPLLDTKNWKGKSRDEFKDTYYIVEHYLDDDSTQLSSIKDMVQGFKDIYDALDVDTAKKVYDVVSDALTSA